MVLVDTSVWIRFLANRTPFATELDHLLDNREVAGHDLVYDELLFGDPGARRVLLASYDLMHRIPTIRHDEVSALVRGQKLHGRGIGWFDAPFAGIGARLGCASLDR